MTIGTDLHQADVKALLEKKGSTLSAVARRNGISPSAVRKGLRRKQAARVKAMIAAALGVAPQSIWPSLFDERGRPTPAQPPKRSTSGRRRNANGRPQ